jgi:glycerol uptake facilitator-like aquaporin
LRNVGYQLRTVSPGGTDPVTRYGLNRGAVAEALGTAFLLMAVVGSGIMGERLAGGNVAIALLANSIATGGALVALIAAFGPISGAHFNPAVTMSLGTQRPVAFVFIGAQIVGAFAGVALAPLMFGLPVFTLSRHVRSGVAQMLAEFIATFGLIFVIKGCSLRKPDLTPYAVAGYITAAYWFTSSTSFANPAVTLARAVSDTFAGIRPQDAPGFIAAQCLGALAAAWLFPWITKMDQRSPSEETTHE